MNEKKITQRKWIPVFILTALLFISGTILIYIKNLNQAVADANIASMKELSSHDSKTIENYLNNVWEEMEAVANRLRLYDCKTVEDVQIRLNLEKSSLELDEIYLSVSYTHLGSSLSSAGRSAHTYGDADGIWR